MNFELTEPIGIPGDLPLIRFEDGSTAEPSAIVYLDGTFRHNGTDEAAEAAYGIAQRAIRLRRLGRERKLRRLFGGEDFTLLFQRDGITNYNGR